MRKRIISFLLAGLMLAGTAAFAGCGNANESSSDGSSDSGSASSESSQAATESHGGVTKGEFANAEKVADGAILQAFCWNFNTIKQSLPDIAAAGYTAVQTSPINACLEGEDGGMELYGDGKWYYHYQPTDFKIGNYQLGTRDEFKALCDEADKYNIKILVDVIANHTTPQLDKISQDLVKAGGGSYETLFHKGNAKDISNWGDRLQCTTYKMGGLPDINTERPSFQEYYLKFANDCIACGADGFRYDTAKHIGLPDDPKEDDGFKNNFWELATKKVDKADDLFIYGEVLQGDNDRIRDYIKEIGRTTASTYGSKIRAALTSGYVDKAAVEEYWLGDTPLNVVTWVESHDNYINDGTSTQLTNDQIAMGWSIIAARKDGTPLFFARPYMCNFDNTWGMNRIGTQGDDIYKDYRVKAVNFFRTAMIGEDETLVNPNGDSSAIIVERGKKGAVIVNFNGELKTGFDINLPDGTYTDRVDNESQYTVKGGKLTSDKPIPANWVVVLYNEGYTEHAPCAEVGVAEGSQFVVTDKDSTELTLKLANAKTAKYSIDGAEAKEFKDGDKITVSKPSSGTVAKIELTAENEKGLPTYERVEVTFRETYKVAKGTKVYFEKPADWKDKLFAYVYDVSGTENSTWPGDEMKKEADGKYSYTFPKDWDSPLIIFADGSDSKQYPADKGFKVEPDKTYTAE